MAEVVFERKPDGKMRAKVALRGRELLYHCLVNKGTGFSTEERRAFAIEGLLPYANAKIEDQVARAIQGIQRKSDPLERYIGLAALQDRNETLFYRLLLSYLDELMPIVYTPTVGLACEQYSHIFTRGRGMWITPDHKGRIYDVLANASYEDVRLIVVTDNERILGLGDQGAGGMGIPIGKLALYNVAAGIHPSQTLPVSLDVGTDNEGLLSDPLYIGWRKPRLRGEPYRAFVDEFVQAVKRRFPRALLQWEDFKKGTAFELLDRYREVLCSFNDDIQGTAAVAVAGVTAACRAKQERLVDQRILILGCGAAGVGIARHLRAALSREGVRGDELGRRVALTNSRGLVAVGVNPGDAYAAEVAWPEGLLKESKISAEHLGDLGTIIRTLRTSVLIGTSGQPGIIDESVVRAMLEHTPAPVIFPLSNPTSKSEAKPEDLLAWTDGRALISSGSPFDPVEHHGRRHRIAQCNNVYVFPGIGLGALVSEAKRVTDSMFTVAADVLAETVSNADLADGTLFPPLSELRKISCRIACAVVKTARDEGVGIDIADAEIQRRVELAMWFPEYPELVPV